MSDQANVTKQEIDAYKYTHIAGFTDAETGRILGITRQGVGVRLRSLKRKRPEIFDKVSTSPTIVSYCDTMAYKIVRKF